MKLISATLGALAVAAVSFVGTAQAQGYYAAPGYSQGGAISLGQTGTIGYRPQYYYGQPQYVVRRTMKPIWALDWHLAQTVKSSSSPSSSVWLAPEAEVMARSVHYAAWFAVLEDCLRVLKEARIYKGAQVTLPPWSPTPWRISSWNR